MSFFSFYASLGFLSVSGFQTSRASELRTSKLQNLTILQFYNFRSSCHLYGLGHYSEFQIFNFLVSENLSLSFSLSFSPSFSAGMDKTSKNIYENAQMLKLLLNSLDDVSGLAPSSAVFFLELNMYFCVLYFYLFLLLEFAQICTSILSQCYKLYKFLLGFALFYRFRLPNI